MVRVWRRPRRCAAARPVAGRGRSPSRRQPTGQHARRPPRSPPRRKGARRRRARRASAARIRTTSAALPSRPAVWLLACPATRARLPDWAHGTRKREGRKARARRLAARRLLSHVDAAHHFGRRVRQTDSVAGGRGRAARRCGKGLASVIICLCISRFTQETRLVDVGGGHSGRLKAERPSAVREVQAPLAATPGRGWTHSLVEGLS